MLLLKVPEVAERLTLRPATVRAWIAQGRLPVVRLGRAIRVKSDDVDRLIQGGYQPGRPHARGRRR